MEQRENNPASITKHSGTRAVISLIFGLLAGFLAFVAWGLFNERSLTAAFLGASVGFFSYLFCIVGIVLGIIGLEKQHRRRGLAAIGLGISGFILLYGLFLILRTHK